MQLCGRCLPRMHKALNSISGMGRRVEQDRKDPQNKHHRAAITKAQVFTNFQAWPILQRQIFRLSLTSLPCDK